MLSGINKWLDGKKTLLGGVAAFGVFLTVVANQLQDGIQMADAQPILIAASAVLLAFGLGGKLQKLIDALKLLK
jgi:hypothetical protein